MSDPAAYAGTVRARISLDLVLQKSMFLLIQGCNMGLMKFINITLTIFYECFVARRSGRHYLDFAFHRLYIWVFNHLKIFTR